MGNEAATRGPRNSAALGHFANLEEKLRTFFWEGGGVMCEGEGRGVWGEERRGKGMFLGGCRVGVGEVRECNLKREMEM